ncbi:MAG: AraC family transcriptional regulator, partial [Vallitaleaceae bacterium]|nr:AraC family transcriptional regulator [Vallitaleaceae bacterium]
ILKPVEDELLIASVERCIHQIEREKQLHEELSKNRLRIERNLFLEKEKFVNNWIRGYFKTEEEILLEIKNLRMQFDYLSLVCIVIKPDHQELSIDQQTWPTRLIEFTISNVAHEFFSKIGFGIEISNNENEVICIIASTKAKAVFERQIRSISKGIKNTILKYTNQPITVGIGGVVEKLNQINTSYKEAKHAVSMNKYLGGGKVFDKSMDKVKFELTDPIKYKLDALLNNIQLGNLQGSRDSLLKLFKDIDLYDRKITPIKLKAIYMDVFNNIINASMIKLDDSINLFEINYKFFEELSRLQTAIEIYQGLEELIILIIEGKQLNNKNKLRSIMRSVIDYIHENYDKSINLNQVANNFYFNATYFCKIFKEETGMPFTKYLMNVRIEKAKELLLQTQYKIYEIGELVGYEDSQYFNKIFKASQGITPIQYRENVR